MKKKIRALIVIGTRPEAIKLAPIVLGMQEKNELFDPIVCSTGQHGKILEEVLEIFQIKPDFSLKLLSKSKNQIELISKCTQKLQTIIESIKPDLIFVQGDTNSCLSGALAGFFNKVKVIHLEAGLRSNDIKHPWPEEANRKLVSEITHLHLCPTKSNRENLLKENIKTNVFVVGNTVIDSLNIALKLIKQSPYKENLDSKFSYLNKGKYIVLTAHRRESHGEGVQEIINAVTIFAKKHPELQIVLPLHPNPNVKLIFKTKLKNISNIFLLNAQDYLSFNYLMKNSLFIISDSGGIQEEAPTLKKKLVLLRNVTERNESIGPNMIVAGLNSKKILSSAEKLVKDPLFKKMKNPYGDGKTTDKILDLLIKKI